MLLEKTHRKFFQTILLFLVFAGCGQGPAAVENHGRESREIQAPNSMPLRPIEELRLEALAADPPDEEGDFFDPDLVEVVKLDPTVKLDVRYATADNFMGEIMYESPRVFLQRPVAEALLEAHRLLMKKGYGVVLFDGYRPWYVTKIFWDATPEDKKEFVADPETGSRHNRGAAVDLAMFDLKSGEMLPMPSGYDETSERAGIDYSGGDHQALANRDLLISVMRLHGFEPLANEWWHYDHQSWRNYPIMNVSFDEIN